MGDVLKFLRRKPTGFDLVASLKRTQGNDPVAYYPQPADAGQGLVDQINSSTERGDIRRLFARHVRARI